MANREYKKIKRIMGDFTQSISGNNGGSGFLEFPTDSTFALEFHPQNLLNVMTKYNIDVDAEMDMMLYSSKGGIYIGFGMLVNDGSDGCYGTPFFTSIKCVEGSGNSQVVFELDIDNGAEASYTSEAFATPSPFTIKDMIEKLEDYTMTGIWISSGYTNAVLAPRLGVKTGSNSNEQEWYDITLDDLRSILNVIPANA